MLRAWCLTLILLVLPLEYAHADVPELGANAALKYWQAFAALPKMSNPEENKLFADYLAMPLDDHAKELVKNADYSLRMMHRGAALPRCDWGIGYEEGIYVRISQGPAARVLASLACLRARIRFEEGHNAEAVDDLLAAMTLSRHLGLDGGLITVVFGYGIERGPIETLALYLPKLDAKTMKDLKTRLAALPAGGRPATAMHFEEKCFLDWFVLTVKESKDNESLVELLGFLSKGSEAAEGKGLDTAEVGRAFLKECGGTPDGVVKFAEELRPWYAQAPRILDLPLDQFEKDWERESKKQVANPVFKRLFPAISKVRNAQARIEVRRAMLSTALAVQLDGRDAVKAHPDHVVGDSFDYVAFDGGFELHSKFKQDGKRLTLTVGQREK